MRPVKLFLTVVFPFFWSVSSYAQCNVTVSNDSLTACVGDTIFLSVSGSQSYEWSHDATLSCDTCTDPYVILTDTSSYVVVKGKDQNFQWATNGNFTSGNTGFLSNYTYNATSIWNASTYAVGPNPNAVHPNFGTWGDHTTGTGNYMLVNGSSTGTKILWRQTVSLPPGAQVTMKWWMLTFVSPAGSLQLKLLGTNIGSTASTPTSTGVWQQTSRSFTAPTSGSAVINLVTISGAGSGTDFGIDDISFEYQCEVFDTVWLAPKPDAQIRLDTTSIFGCDSVCFTIENQLDTLGLLNYQWIFSDGTVDSNMVFSHCIRDTGDYTGYLLTSSLDGCVDSAALPHVRVGHTRQLDSLITVSDNGSLWNGMWIMDPQETLGIGAHFEARLGNNGMEDSLYIKVGAQGFSNGNISASQMAAGWSPITVSGEHFNVCAYLFTSEGCVDSLCREVAFYPSVSVPNFLTPNGDGINDELFIEQSNTEMLHQKIFNRWGQLIFESFDPSIMWKGTYDGTSVAPGVYFIDVKATNTYSIIPVTYQGAIHVMD